MLNIRRISHLKTFYFSKQYSNEALCKQADFVKPRQKIIKHKNIGTPFSRLSDKSSLEKVTSRSAKVASHSLTPEDRLKEDVKHKATFTIFKNLKKSSLMAAVLIAQGEELQKHRLITDSTHDLLVTSVTYLKTAFPKWQEEMERNEAFIAQCIRPDNPRNELRHYLKNVEKNNMEYAAFVNVCVAIGDLKAASYFIQKRQTESKSIYGLLNGILPKDPTIYERLAQGYAKAGNIKGILQILSWISESGWKPSLRTYLYGLQCLGRSKSPNLHNIQTLKDSISAHGFDLETCLSENVKSKEEMKLILTALLMVDPSFRPSTSLQNHIFTHHPVLLHLQSQPSGGVNPSHDVVKMEELRRGYERQMEVEAAGGLLVKPVVETGDKIEDPVRLKEKRDALIEERNIWRSQLSEQFDQTLKQLQVAHERGSLTAYPFLKLLPKSEYIEIMISEVDHLISQTAFQFLTSFIVYSKLGQRVETAFNLKVKKERGITEQMSSVYKDYLELYNRSDFPEGGYRELWDTALTKHLPGTSLEQDLPEWNMQITALVGVRLYGIIYQHLKFNLKGLSFGNPPREEAPALFEVISEYPTESRTEVKIHPLLIKWYKSTGFLPLRFLPTELPMLCPPLPWASDLHHAGYFIAKSYATRLIRKSTAGPANNLDFNPSKITPVFDALNILGACPWKVNTRMLDQLLYVFRKGGDKSLNIPQKQSNTEPPVKLNKDMTYEEKRAAYKQIQEFTKQKAESNSLWASELYRLSIANKFRDKSFWLPHSMDFRGRVYPCAPHFNHMGSDVSRCILQFAKGKPLGDQGLDWLKIHLVNLTGLKKRASQKERLAFADEHMDDIMDSADRPFSGRGWWRNDEDAWQTLACCMELTRALRHPQGPSHYVSHFPVHQDGSCNGLQHYAALGRDQKGAHSVNLTHLEVPQDVYADVVELVEAQRAQDEAAGVEVARVLSGFVRRKVIKQSVMTTVYGVTLYGAKLQIARQLSDLEDFPRDWVTRGSAYIAKLTLGSIGKIFTSSTEIQNWFAQIAHNLASQRGCHVTWDTPLGLPVKQPYSHTRQPPSLQALHQRNWQLQYEPDPLKQKNAFPPNFIHSLDSVHMMITALHCSRAGVTFASVHDCFWTHPSTVDVMNKICREEFVALHSQPILENLSDYMISKFSYTDKEISDFENEALKQRAVQFNKLLQSVPSRGDFNLNEVLDSTYFFS